MEILLVALVFLLLGGLVISLVLAPLLIWVVIPLLGLAATIFWIWMLVECAMKEPSTGNEKIVWVLVILFTHFIGALLYLIIRRPQRIAQCGQ